MPEISRFLGIIIMMYFDEHNPPHFHVKYNEHAAVFNIRTLNIFAGHLPARVRGLVEEWAELHSARVDRDVGNQGIPQNPTFGLRRLQ